MPELPEVETTRRGIEPLLAGAIVQQIVVRNHALRWPVPDNLHDLVENQKLLAIERRGKYLLFRFAAGTVLWHLGMSGSLRIVKPDQPFGKHDHLDWLFDNQHVLRFNDPRRFGAVLWAPGNPLDHKLLHHLGPEPLTGALDGAYLYRKSRNRVQSVKTWLMDSRIVVGVGNIYANEALFLSRLHPARPAGKLSRPRCELLAANVKAVLSQAIASGGTTLRDFVGGDGKPGYFAQQLNVYGRTGLPCTNCGSSLLEIRLGQRSTVFCSRCQK